MYIYVMLYIFMYLYVYTVDHKIFVFKFCWCPLMTKIKHAKYFVALLQALHSKHLCVRDSPSHKTHSETIPFYVHVGQSGVH